MNEFRIDLYDKYHIMQRDHVTAETAQEVADQIRKDWPECHIIRISLVVNDWE